MLNYLDLLADILKRGHHKTDRTGTGTLSVFGRQLRFSLANGALPFVTTKKLHIQSVLYELLWFLSGSVYIDFLQRNGVSIWNAWAKENGYVGPLYGYQWRHWPSPLGDIDQISRVVEQIKLNPDSRRHVVSAWNVADLPDMALPPCHYALQFYVQSGKLSCMFNMRSTDVFLGLPFNIASYALLTHMVAQQCGLEPYEVIFSGGDVHLYINHITQAQLQLTREPLPPAKLLIRRKPVSILDYRYEDFEIVDYCCHPAISAPISV